MQSRNKNFMQTIFEVSIQPTAGYLVKCQLSNHEVSKRYCNHMKQKFCHLLFTLANVRGALELGSGLLVRAGTLIFQSSGSGPN